MDHGQQIQQVEIDIETAQEQIDLAEALERLHSSLDFKKVFVQGYFKDEASRIVLLKADAHFQGADEQKQANDIITSIGGLRQYFGKVFAMAEMAHRAIEDHKEARQEMLAEDLEQPEAIQ